MDDKLKILECRAYAFNSERYCSKVYEDAEEKCHSKLKYCCEESPKICQATPLHKYLLYSSIGCLVFLVLIGAVVFWKTRKAKKPVQGQLPMNWTNGQGANVGTTRATGTNYQEPRGTDADDDYFDPQ